MQSKTKFHLKIFILGFFLCLPFANPAGNIMSSTILGASKSLVENHNFELTFPFPYQVIDSSFVNGKLISGLPPGASVFAISTYPIAKAFDKFLPKSFVKDYETGIDLPLGRKGGLELPIDYKFEVIPFIYWHQLASVIFINFTALSLIGLMTFILLGNYQLSFGWRICLSILALVGTSLFPISTAFGKEALATFFGFLAFYFFKSNSLQFSKLNKYFLTGSSAGIAICCNYPSAIIAICLMIFFIRPFSSKNLFQYLLGLALPLILLGLYHNEYLGSPFSTAYQYRLNELWQGHRKGLSGLTGFQWNAFWGITFSFFQGIFIYQPFLFFAVFGIISLGRKSFNTDNIFFLAILLCFIGAFSCGDKIIVWSGAFLGWGPRHLVPALPFMVLLLGYFISSIKNKTLLFGVKLSVLLSFSIQLFCAILGGRYYPDLEQKTLMLLSDPTVLSANPILTMSSKFFTKGQYHLLFTELFGKMTGTIFALILFAILAKQYFLLLKEKEGNQ